MLHVLNNALFDVSHTKLKWHAYYPIVQEVYLSGPPQVVQWKLCDYLVVYVVVYDDDITDAFFSCLTFLFSEVFTTHQPVVYVAVEKRWVMGLLNAVAHVCSYSTFSSYRINFTLEDLAAVSPAHQYFMQCITRHHMTQRGGVVKFTASEIPLQTITQCFNYDRNDHMVRW